MDDLTEKLRKLHAFCVQERLKIFVGANGGVVLSWYDPDGSGEEIAVDIFGCHGATAHWYDGADSVGRFVRNKLREAGVPDPPDD